MGNSSEKKSMQYKGNIHHVKPHFVKSYVKKDGTFVSGTWRDGDGNSKVKSFGGYFAANPGHKK